MAKGTRSISAKARPQRKYRKIWEPQPRQAQALACPAFELFYGGAKGGGKSDFLLGDFLANVEEWGAAWKGIIFRRTYDELEEIIARAKDIFTYFPGAYWAEGKRTWHFPTEQGEATLKFRYLESEKDVGHYNGHQYTWIGWDELTEFPSSEAYIFMLGCARSAAGAPCYIRATGNPGRPGHNWIKSRFIKVAAPFEIYTDPVSIPGLPPLTRCFIPARLEDNEILMRNNPQYQSQFALMPTHLLKALRYGDWDSISGQVFLEYSAARNLLRRFAIGPEYFRFVAMDWGYAKPFSIGWYAVNMDGRVIRYREWYGCEPGKENVGIRMGANRIAETAWRMGLAEGVTVMVADPACWGKRGEGDGEDTPSIAQSFEAAGFDMVRGNNDRHQGIMKLHELMSLIGEDGKAYFCITEDCPEWMRTVPLLTPDPRDPEDINTALEDHPFDETKYAVTSEYVLNPRALRRPTQNLPTRGKRQEYDVLRH
jgi:hypothetical protein